MELTAIAFTVPLSVILINSHNRLTPRSVFQDGSSLCVASGDLLKQDPPNGGDVIGRAEVKATQVATNSMPWQQATTDTVPQRVASTLTISGILTLLSKCFSTFPHGTCSLSVSDAYLAADGGYHQTCALLPKSVTQMKTEGQTC